MHSTAALYRNTWASKMFSWDIGYLWWSSTGRCFLKKMFRFKYSVNNHRQKKSKYESAHSSEVRGLCLMKGSKKIL